MRGGGTFPGGVGSVLAVKSVFGRRCIGIAMTSIYGRASARQRQGGTFAGGVRRRFRGKKCIFRDTYRTCYDHPCTAKHRPRIDHARALHCALPLSTRKARPSPFPYRGRCAILARNASRSSLTRRRYARCLQAAEQYSPSGPRLGRGIGLSHSAHSRRSSLAIVAPFHALRVLRMIAARAGRLPD